MSPNWPTGRHGSRWSFSARSTPSTCSSRIRAPQIDADGLNHTFIQVYVAGYVLISLYFFVYAIMALRPRVGRMHRVGETRSKGGLPGLRLMNDILATDIDDYYELWRTAEVGQLDREMALQAYLLARANAEKFQAVRRVFHGSAAARRPDRAARRDHRPPRHGRRRRWESAAD